MINQTELRRTLGASNKFTLSIFWYKEREHLLVETKEYFCGTSASTGFYLYIILMEL